MVDAFSELELAANIQIDLLTVENLRRAVEKRSEVIHIICKGPPPALKNCLEVQEDVYSTFVCLNKAQLDCSKVQLLVISAVCPEWTAECFKKLGAANLVLVSTAVDQKCNASAQFVNYFYSNLPRMSVKGAFSYSTDLVQMKLEAFNDEELYSCCCQHEHNPTGKCWVYERVADIRNIAAMHLAHKEA